MWVWDMGVKNKKLYLDRPDNLDKKLLQKMKDVDRLIESDSVLPRKKFFKLAKKFFDKYYKNDK